MGIRYLMNIKAQQKENLYEDTHMKSTGNLHLIFLKEHVIFIKTVTLSRTNNENTQNGSHRDDNKKEINELW